MPVASSKFRHLGRDSQHRQALLRNLIDKLFEHEQITTTWPKAKAAQRVAEKLITLGKRNDEIARRKAQAMFYRPELLLPKLFGEFRERYANRPGGYTRVLRVEPKKEDQAPSAILEMVDSPRDMRFMLTARTLAYRRSHRLPMNETTAANVKKVTAFRDNGVAELRKLVATFEGMKPFEGDISKLPVYPDPMLRPPKERARLESFKKKRDSPWE